MSRKHREKLEETRDDVKTGPAITVMVRGDGRMTTFASLNYVNACHAAAHELKHDGSTGGFGDFGSHYEKIVMAFDSAAHVVRKEEIEGIVARWPFEESDSDD